MVAGEYSAQAARSTVGGSPGATPEQTGVFGAGAPIRRTFAAVILGLGAACQPVAPPVGQSPTSAHTSPKPVDPGFSGAKALERARALMGLPRGLGDSARDESIGVLATMLSEDGADQVIRVPQRGRDAETGTEYALTTVVAHYRPSAPHRFVLGSHFDTRPWAEEDPDPTRRGHPVPGANDGTSGVAVLMELAPQLVQELPNHVGFSVILFDGEELGRPGDRNGYCVGSRSLAGAIERGEHPLLQRATFGIVLDMVGDTDLRLPREQTSVRSHPALVEHLWQTAQSKGLSAFVDGPGPAIIDDHAFLTRAGIPSVLIIDYDYPPWHTTADTLDRVSAHSLGQVGEAVRLAVTEWPWPPSQ